MDSNVVSSLIWIKKGFAMANPKEFEINEADIEEMRKDPLVRKNKGRELGTEIEDENDFQDVDEDDDEEEHMPIFTTEINMLKNDDLVDEDGNPIGFDEMSDEEKEDFHIKPTDALLIAAKIEKEFSSLEVYVFEEDKNNLFVHHEIQLSAFPLCVEWLRVQPSSFEETVQKPGNYAIVSSFLPGIEVWNLDVLNVIEPTFTLGGEVSQSSKQVKRFKKPQKQLKPGSHTDAVLSLNLNPFRYNILASGSADKSVKVWDLGQQKNIYSYTHHADKVQVVQWNKQEEAILLTASYDRKISMFDVRTPENIMSVKIQSDIESAIWDPTNSNSIVFSTEDGHVSCIDARKFTLDYLYHFQGHEKATTSVSMSPSVGGMLATTSVDHTVKVWDTTQINGKKPKLISMKNPNAGKLFCGSFYEDSPWVFACGNSKGEVFVWDTTEDRNVVENFSSRVDDKHKPDASKCTQPGQKNFFAKEGRDEDDDEADEMDEENENMV